MLPTQKSAEKVTEKVEESSPGQNQEKITQNQSKNSLIDRLTDTKNKLHKGHTRSVSVEVIEAAEIMIRPNSLKFNDSGISDIGSSANSIASTPENELVSEKKPNHKKKH